MIRFLQDEPRFVIAAGELELVFEAGEIFVLSRLIYHINYVNQSLTDSLICVCSRLRQIGVFRSLKGDCTRLRHLRMSWIVLKGRASILYHTFVYVIYHTFVLSQFKKSKAGISQISRFLALRADCARLKGHIIL